jgi:hypothetical protein
MRFHDVHRYRNDALERSSISLFGWATTLTALPRVEGFLNSAKESPAEASRQSKKI